MRERERERERDGRVGRKRKSPRQAPTTVSLIERNVIEEAEGKAKYYPQQHSASPRRMCTITTHHPFFFFFLLVVLLPLFAFFALFALFVGGAWHRGVGTLLLCSAVSLKHEPVLGVLHHATRR